MIRHLTIIALLCAGCGDKDDTGAEVGGDDTAADTEDTDTAPDDTATDAVTYADVEPILASHCVVCHVDGGGAPFAFDGYEAASSRADRIVARAVDGDGGSMPPSGLTLSTEEADMIVSWAEAGAPE